MRVQELFDLQGKTAIVTGGGSGIGRQMAGALAELGANLVLCARKVERCEQAAEELAQLGVRDLAHKWAQYGVRVNAIAPGWFPSDMSKVLLDRHGERFLEGIPLRRFGGPD